VTDAVGETSKDATAVNGLDTSAESSAGGVAAAPASSGGDAACGACGAALRSGDAFCENCGAAASGGPTGSPPDSPVGSPADPSAAAPPTPESVSNPASMSMPAPGAPNCRACGGAVLDDGFCGTCGERGRLPRDHWLEAPAPQLAGVCDKGIRHARNEDGMALGVAGTGASVAVVCDGVTTAPQSDRASLAAARAAAALLLDAAPAAQGSFAARIERWTALLGEACRSANEVAIGVARTLGDPPEPPSCTFAAGVVDPDGLVAFAWCGDSRVYWLPDDGNAVVSVDHSLGAAMIAEGMDPDEAARQPGFHTITRWLGADSVDPHAEVVTLGPVGPGWLLVCSDGLWNYASSPDRAGRAPRRCRTGRRSATFDRRRSGGGARRLGERLRRTRQHLGGARPR
jgi:serine/threonine protein phosphatase PrpC